MRLINLCAIRMRTKRGLEQRSMFKQINGWMRDWCDQQIALSCHMLFLLFFFCILEDYQFTLTRLLCKPKSNIIADD